MPKAEKAREIHRRLAAERRDDAREDLADQLVDMVAQIDAEVVRALVTRDSARLAGETKKRRA